MVFSSGVFLYLFAPLFFAVYFLTPNRFRNLTIVVGSYIFYGWWRPDFLLLLVSLTLWAYCVSLLIHALKAQWMRNAALAVGVIVNLSALIYFKYFMFLVRSWNIVAVHADMRPSPVPDILLPIGVSFFTFQVVSYLIDVWRRDVEPARNLIDLAAFKAIFPQLIAGPVLRYKDLDDQFRERTHTWEKFGEGTRRFIYGFALKVLLADSVEPMVTRAFAHHRPGFGDAWLGILAYSAQLFCDFAGYSSMAIGLALMMGFRFIENFNNPYAAVSITDFWRRWHISLSTWLRDYLYISLGGNRKGELRTYVNLFLTMLIGGFWHGANWTFILWGALHGGMMVIERATARKGEAPGLRPRHLLGWPFTLLFVMLAWVPFHTATVGEAFAIYRGAFGFNGLGLGDDLSWSFRFTELVFLAIAYVFIGLGIRRAWAGKSGSHPSGSPLETLWLAILLVLGLTKLAASSFSPFLYFQF